MCSKYSMTCFSERKRRFSMKTEKCYDEGRAGRAQPPTLFELFSVLKIFIFSEKGFSIVSVLLIVSFIDFPLIAPLAWRAAIFERVPQTATGSNVISSPELEFCNPHVRPLSLFHISYNFAVGKIIAGNYFLPNYFLNSAE